MSGRGCGFLRLSRSEVGGAEWQESGGGLAVQYDLVWVVLPLCVKVAYVVHCTTTET